MPQGQINQSQRKPSAFENILKGLEAVQTVYGINTEGARQRLLEAQTENEKTKGEREKQALDLKKAEDSAFLEYVSRMKNKAGGPPEASNAQAPGQIDPIVSEAIQNPMLAERFEPYLKAQQSAMNLGKTALEEAHINQQMNLARREETRKGQEETRKEQGQIGDYQKDFTERYPGVKEAMDEIGEHNSISKLLLSGSKQGVQIGGTKLVLVASGLKRLGPQLMELGVDQSVLGKIQNAISEGRTGFKTPEEIDALNKVNNLMGQEANNRLDQLGSSAAAQVGSRLNQDPGVIKTKYLLPQNSLFKPSESRVAPHPHTGQNTLWRLKDNGKYSPVISNE